MIDHKGGNMNLIQKIIEGARSVRASMTWEAAAEIAARVADKRPDNPEAYAWATGRNAAIDARKHAAAERRAEIRAKKEADERARALSEARRVVLMAEKIVNIAWATPMRLDWRMAVLSHVLGDGASALPAPSANCAHQWLTRGRRALRSKLSPEESAILARCPGDIRRAREMVAGK